MKQILAKQISKEPDEIGWVHGHNEEEILPKRTAKMNKDVAENEETHRKIVQSARLLK